MTVAIVLGSAVLYLAAYHTYGRFLARKIFRLDPTRKTPAAAHPDGKDYVPSRREVVFGHHFVSIAGTGPIVGPALAIVWGWVPALVWILVGSIVMGAVHDFGALVVSLRREGRSIGDICAEVISPRVRVLMLFIIFFCLLIVLAVFGLVMAVLFQMYPQAVFPVWCEIPIAVGLGYFVARWRGSKALWVASLVAVTLMYVTVYLSAVIPALGTPLFGGAGSLFGDPLGLGPLGTWTVVLLLYAFVASVLPVQTLLQPRDFINSHQLFLALGLLLLAVVISAPPLAAPAVRLQPAGAPPFFPFLFVTIACGAISGFHSLVSSGTSAKQVAAETDAQLVGYGSMLLEGFLAVLVIAAVAAGVGLRHEVRFPLKAGTVPAESRPAAEFKRRHPGAALRAVDARGQEVAAGAATAVAWQARLTGEAAWRERYDKDWAQLQGLGPQVGAFVEGSAEMIARGLGFPVVLAVVIMGVLVASFAGTTLDTATRLQRYVVGEIGVAGGLPALGNEYLGTTLAAGSALFLALSDGVFGAGHWGQGALILWPLFGATNQLLAGLALLVVTVFLYRAGRPVWYTLAPMLLMVVMTGWAMISLVGMLGANCLSSAELPYRWLPGAAWHLLVLGLLIFGLQVWMLAESLLLYRRLRGQEPAARALALEGER